MRLGVISDTHGDRWAIEECIQLAGHVDAWLHLGDNVRDTKTLEATDVPVYGVRGNTDFGTSQVTERIVELGGKRLFLCHGHTYGVEAGLTRLYLRAKELGCHHPEIVLHLDHGDSFELCKSCVDMGFSSVMIDGSHLPYDENVALTKKVVEYAHQFDVTVEGELGVLAGVEDEVVAEHHTYTRPEEVVDFVTKTGCDSLAISIGTSHGAYKFKPEQCHVDPATGRLVPPPLAFDVLDGVMKELPGFPIVLHGSSSVPQEEVDTINKYGGKLVAAIGIPEEELRKAAKSAVCKINIDSDSRLAMTAAIRRVFAENPAEFDPRKYLGPARDNMQKLYEHKIVNVLGSDNKLANLD